MSQTKLLEQWGGGEGKVPLSDKWGQFPVCPFHTPAQIPASKIPPGSWRLRTIKKFMKSAWKWWSSFFYWPENFSWVPKSSGSVAGVSCSVEPEEQINLRWQFYTETKWNPRLPALGWLIHSHLLFIYCPPLHLFPESAPKRTSRSFQKLSPVPFDFGFGLSVFNFKFLFYSHQTHQGKQAT